MRLIFTLLLLWSLLPALPAQDLYFPPTFGTWETISPTEDLHWCPEKLDSLQSFLGEKNTKAFIMLKGGRIAVEWYYDDFTQDSIWYWASAGKTVTATLVGIAQEEGFLQIDDPTSDYLGEGWTSCSLTEEEAITLRHQLTMTTGFNDPPAVFECTDPSCLECLQAPGTRWSYHNAPYTLLTHVVENATDLTINQFFASRIGNKIGAFGAFVSLGYNRVFFSRPRDMARFGLMILAGGNWNGTPVLNDGDYLQAMTTSSQNLNPSYGYLWWLNGQDSYLLPGSQILFNGNLIPSAPDDLFAGLGKNDQKVYIVPSQDLVVIRMGDAAAPVAPALSGFDNDLWAQIGALECLTSTGEAMAPEASLRVFPNPVIHELEVRSTVPIEHLELFNLTGQRLRLEKRTTSLDLSHYPQGIYLLKSTLQNGQVIVTRIVKQDGA